MREVKKTTAVPMRVGVRQGAGGWLHPRAELGEDSGVDVVRLRRPAQRLRNCAHLPRIDDGDTEESFDGTDDRRY